MHDKSIIYETPYEFTGILYNIRIHIFLNTNKKLSNEHFQHYVTIYFKVT